MATELLAISTPARPLKIGRPSGRPRLNLLRAPLGPTFVFTLVMNTKFAIQLVLIVGCLCSTATADEGRMEKIATLIDTTVPADLVSKNDCIEDIRVEVTGEGEVGHLALAIRSRRGGRSRISRSFIQDVPPFSPERLAVSREVNTLESGSPYGERFCARQDNPFQKPFQYQPPTLPQIIR